MSDLSDLQNTAALAPGRAKEGAPIVLGAVLPSTPTDSDLAPYAARCKVAFEMAAADFQAGATKAAVQFLYRDSATDASKAAEAARDLVEGQQVFVIIGEVSGSHTTAMVSAVKGKALVLSPLAATPQLTGIDPLFFSVWPSDIGAMRALAAHLTEQRAMKRLAVVRQDSPGAAAGARAFGDACAERRGAIRLTHVYPKRQPDLPEIADALKRAEADLDGIVLLGWATEMGQVARALREAGVKAPLAAELDFASAEALDAAGPAADGVLIARPVYDPKGSEVARKFADSFARQHGGRLPELEDACAYDAVTLVASGVARGCRDAPALAAYLSGLKGYEGASGAITFDQGMVHRPHEIRSAR
jgi:branched-chain amino acid transport system substrate-binding protein